MTEETARDLLTYLVPTFLNNGFSDVGSFLLPEYGAEDQFEQDGETYQYQDSSTALQDMLADAVNRPKDALRRLLMAARQYFDRATAIPNRYAVAIATFDSSRQLPMGGTIRLLGRDQESITDVSQILQSRPVQEMQRLLSLLAERIEGEDDSFLNELDNL